MAKSYLMDFTKIQSDVLKAAFNEKANSYFYGTCENYTGKYHIISDGHMIVFIPEIFYYLNDEKVFHNKMPWTGANEFLKYADDAKRIKLTSELKMIPGSKNPLMIFKTETEEKIYIDTALYKLFEKAPALTYKGTNAKSPIYIYSNDNIIGCVLPVYVKESAA